MEATSQEKIIIEHSAHLFAPYHKWNQVSDNNRVPVSVGLDQRQQRA